MLFSKNKFFSISVLALSSFISGCDNVDDIAVVRAPQAVQIENGQIMRGGPCAVFAPWGFPQPVTEKRGVQYICHDGYAVQYNRANGVSDWVVEHITANDLSQKIASKTNDLRPDPAINDDFSVKNSDYKDSETKGWVPGQLVNYKDFINSKKQTSQSNYLTNIAPMNPILREGAYNLLNQNIRQWAKDYGEVYVMSGAVYLYGQNYGYLGRTSGDALVVSGKNAKLGSDERGIIAVPTHFYKIILAPKIKQIRVFLIPNQPVQENQLPQFSSTLKTVESITGYNIFPQIPDSFKNTLLNQIGQWPIRTGLE